MPLMILILPVHTLAEGSQGEYFSLMAVHFILEVE